MIEDAIERSGFAWQFIHQYQTFLAGWLTLIAGLFALAAAWAIVKEGKRQRAFKMNQHKIEMQTKRRAVAMMLAADIWSGIEILNLAALAKTAEKEADKFKCLEDDEPSTPLFFALIYQSFLNNYSHYIENIPLMRIETVLEVSRFYLYATKLSEVIALSNAKMEGSASNKTKAGFLANISGIAKFTQIQHEKTLPLLKQERKEAQEELDRLNGVKEQSDASAP